MRTEQKFAGMTVAALLASTVLAAPCFAQANPAPVAQSKPVPEEEKVDPQEPPVSEEAAEAGPADIIITAERYGGTVRTTPVSVTALNDEQLADRQVKDVRDLVNQVPGIVLAPATAGVSQMKVVVRGAGTETGGIRTSGTVGVYIDNVIQPRPMGQFFDFFDTGRVEFLRGPQGTLYGRNTMGGAIKLLTKQPSFNWTSAAQLSIGNWNAREAKLYASGPLIGDVLAFSLSGVHRQRDGYIKGLQYGEKIGDLKRSAERLKLLLKPSERLTFNLSAYAMQDKSDNNIPLQLTVIPGVVDPYATGGGRDLTVNEVFADLYQKVLQWGASLNATYELTDNLQLGSITGYGKLKQKNGGNDTHLTPARIALNNGQLVVSTNTLTELDDKWWSQELNLIFSGDRLKAVAGVYYFYEKGSQQGAAAGSQTDDATNVVKAPAVFAQATYEFGSGVSVVGGLRYTREKTDYFAHTLGSAAGPQVGHATDSAFTPKLGVNWEVNDQLFTYASWTRGTRSGGFNSRDPVTAVLVPTPYDAEWVDSYEVGAKTNFSGFRLNATAYLADYTDLQLTTIIPGQTFLVVLNAGAARVWGLELEPNWQVTENLNLYSNIGLNKGKYTKDFTCGNQFGVFVDCTDRKIKGLPARKISTGFRFTPAISALPGELTLNGSWDHTSKIYNNISNEPDLVQTKTLNLFNASIGWRQGRWEALLEGRNLTNKHYVQAGFLRSHPTSPAVVGYIGDPRQIMLRLGYAF